MSFDLLTTVEYGGCSAKLSPVQLGQALRNLPKVTHPDLLVDIETHDDAGVFRISDTVALVQTTDFFSPICSDPFEFGEIAAANALSDVSAMGGIPLTALNLVMFPSEKIPLEVLGEILLGGQNKINEAGAVTVGGHTIDDYPPKYGLAVTGTVHPDHVITNSGAKPGDVLLLTKPLGTGIIVAGRRIGKARDADYQGALDTMKQLNRGGGQIMQKYGVRCATDITGFSLLGHGYKLALASHVTLEFESSNVPLLKGAWELAELGCIPGAAFRNLRFIEENCFFGQNVEYNRRMVMLDAQTSGGLLMCVPENKANLIAMELVAAGYSRTCRVGTVVPEGSTAVRVI